MESYRLRWAQPRNTKLGNAMQVTLDKITRGDRIIDDDKIVKITQVQMSPISGAYMLFGKLVYTGESVRISGHNQRTVELVVNHECSWCGSNLVMGNCSNCDAPDVHLYMN